MQYLYPTGAERSRPVGPPADAPLARRPTGECPPTNTSARTPLTIDTGVGLNFLFSALYYKFNIET